MSFIAPEDGVVHLAIFDITGALVKEVFRGEVKEGQSYQFTADAADFKGSLYISKLTMGEQSSYQKLMLNRK
jgi:rubrerythrin